MAGYRIDRITSDIKLALSELLRNMKDPRVSRLLSIVKVDVSGDLSYATVYVSAIEGYEKTVSSVKALKGAAGATVNGTLNEVKAAVLKAVGDTMEECNAGADINR